MKTRKMLVELICFMLLMFWFYEGIYKVAYFQQFGFYITHAPLLKSIGGILKWIIPFGEVGLAILFLIPKCKIAAFYITIGALLVFIIWIVSVSLFTSYIFWPYHALWNEPNWGQRMLLSLGICWISFAAIIMSNANMVMSKKINSSSLRNKPANAR